MASFLAQRHIFFICTLLHAVAGLLNDNFILVGDSGSGSTGLYQIDIQTGNTINVLPSNEIPSSIIGVAYNPRSRIFFYSDVQRNRILQYSPALGKPTVLFEVSDDASHIDGLAVDFVSSKLYYADTRQILGIIHDGGIIGVIDLKTGRHSRVINHPRLKPRAIQVDVYNSKLYFTDWDEDPGIYVINLNPGESARRLVSTNLYWPNGLAIDFRAGVMYWADVRPGDYPSRIEMANLDGTGRRVLLEERNSHYYGLALDSTYLYLTDWNYYKVRRIHRSNVSVSPLPSSKDFGKLHGIYAYISGFEPEMPSTTVSNSTSTTLTTTITSSTTQRSGTTSPTESSASGALSSTEAIMDSGGSALHAILMQAINNPLYLVSVIVIIITVIVAVTVCCVKRSRNRREASANNFHQISMGAVNKGSTLGYSNEEYCYIPADHFNKKDSASDETAYRKLLRENELNDRVQNAYDKLEDVNKYSRNNSNQSDKELYLSPLSA